MPYPYLTQTRLRHRHGFVTHEVLAPDRLPVRTYLPKGYEPNYPYPLVVFFHPHGGNERQVLRLAPRLSDRNYISIGLRGPELVEVHPGRSFGYAWGDDGPFDSFLEEYLFRAVEQTRRLYHVHSERIYLAGICEGSAQAYRLALAYPENFAGIIALNGTLPPYGNPLFRWPDVRSLRVFIGHGLANAYVPLSLARRDFRLLYTAGLDVNLGTYRTTHRLHADMLRDVNRWLMAGIDEAEAV